MQYSLYEKKSVKIPTPRYKKRKKRILRILGVTVIVVVLLAVALTIWSMWPSSPDMIVTLGTEGELTVDGDFIGIGTEFLLQDLEAGIHAIAVKPTTTVPFLVEEKLDVNLKLGASETVNMLSVSNLSITSDPPSAKVIASSTHGEIKLGVTPIQTLIPVGHYEITVSLPGYPEFRQSLLVTDDKELTLNADLVKIALSRPGAKKLVNNLNISSLESGSSLVINGKKYTEPGLYAIEPGIGELTLKRGQNDIITTDVVFPSVGKPVVLSCPKDIGYPCLHFGQKLCEIPKDAINLTISEDGRILLYSTIHRWIYKHVNAVDLLSGELLWVSDINSSWERRPVIIGGANGSKVYGMAGVPPLNSAKPFILDIETGFEESDLSTNDSILSMISEGENTSLGTAYAHVWTGRFWSNTLKSSLEVLFINEGKSERYINVLDDGWTAKYLGCVSSGGDDRRPLFIFYANKGRSSKLIIFDITRIPKQLDVQVKSGENNKPDEENNSPGWISIQPPFAPLGAVSDVGYDLHGSIIIFNENTTACISYPKGMLKWKRYFSPSPNNKPILRTIKNQNVVLYTFDLSPFELQLDIATGDDIFKRTQPSNATETYGSPPCGDGVYIRNNTAFSGIFEDSDGSYVHQWKRSFDTGKLFPSLWGVLHVTKERIELLGSHGLEGILTFSLPGFSIEENIKILSTQDHLAIHSGSRLWLVDRDGLLKGYYPGVEKIERFDEHLTSALSVSIAGRTLIIPWPD